MNGRLSGIGRWVVGVSILLCLFLPADAQSHRRHRTQGTGKLSTKLSAIHRKRASIQRELRKTSVQKKWVVQDINKVDTKLVTVQHQLQETSDRLDDNRHLQSKLADELVDTTHRLDETREQLRRRLRAVYEEGNTSYFEVLAGAESFGDLAVRADMLQSVTQQDRDLFERYISLRQGVADRKRRQDHVVREIGRLAVNQKHQQVALRDVRGEKQEFLEGLEAKQDQLKAMIRQFAQDEAEITAEIQAYMRRIAAMRRMMRKRIRRGNRVVEVEVPAPPLVFNGRFSRPINARITSTFGMRFHPILHITRMHTGVDFGAAYGSTIHAAGDGYVISTSYLRGYGQCVIIDHGSGISTVYAHTSAVFVRAGQHVGRGQSIAAVGSTGLSTGPHLHFEVRRNGRPVNPLGRF